MQPTGFRKTLDLDSEPIAFDFDVRVRLRMETPFFGPGVAELMASIELNGSVAGACYEMGMSYSKGRGIIRKMEKMLDMPIVERVQGGMGGGGARLTERGKHLMQAYLAYEQDVKGYAKARFEEAFCEFKDSTKQEG